MLPRALPRVGHCWGVGVAAAPLLVVDLEVDGLEVDGGDGFLAVLGFVLLPAAAHSV